MKEIDAGHKYILNELDPPKGIISSQLLTFVKREGQKFPGNIGHYSGTNLQEVLRACIARVKYLDHQVPCGENKLILHELRTAIFWLESRAADRHGRKFSRLPQSIEELPTCLKCGHIDCDQHGEYV